MGRQAVVPEDRVQKHRVVASLYLFSNLFLLKSIIQLTSQQRIFVLRSANFRYTTKVRVLIAHC